MALSDLSGHSGGAPASPAPEEGPLPSTERLARLRLARSRNVGPRTYVHLIARFRSGRAALDALPELAARGGGAGYGPCPEETAAAEWESGARLGARLHLLGEADYPRQLSTISTPPPAVWVLGEDAVFARPSAAIVGARNASALGLRTARQLARGLGAAGRVVVSGLARGIDSAAHEASLETGTIAVLPGGLDRIYPPENERLAARIAEAGALVSECPLGMEATARHFPKRNRLIAGLAAGVVLIEAASRSGSLITARYALEQGREVMAVPGSPEDPRSGGCNALIRDGAALVRNAEDVLDALAMPARPGLAEEGAAFAAAPPEAPDLDAASRARDAEAAERVAALLGPAPVEIDELARAAGVRPAHLSLVLLELELAGRVEVLAGGRVAAADPEG